MSIPGYDDAVPDLSPEYQQAWRGRLVGIIARGAGYETDGLGTGHRVLLETARDTAARELAAADSRVYDFSVTTFPLGGPSLVLLTASRTSVTDPASALAYLARCRQVPAYLDQHAARLRAAARDGLAPVAPLVSDAIRQLEHYRSHPERDPMLAHRPPEGWAGAAAARRGAAAGHVPSAVPAAVSRRPHAAAYGRVRRAAVLLAARPGRLASRRVPVQRRASRAGRQLGA
jgi:uncharacterized protein (DUF885 family)